jgi:3-oxoacyl-[acyl-carrier-protein] synthase-1
LSGACASSSHAVGQAADLIAAGRQKVMICGGAQEITWEAVCSFDALCAFSLRENDPAAASRPFDRDRDGLVPSGGAAALILEDRDYAIERGAKILGEVCGYAFSSDGGHIAVPNGDGIERCMRDALDRANVLPSQIDYLCAHGTSTPVGDAVEAEAISRVFSSGSPWVSSLKSMTGHEMWMSGAAQVVYTLLAAGHGFIPGNLNFSSPDERTRGLRINPETLIEEMEYVLCNAAGFGGTNSCLVLRTTE